MNTSRFNVFNQIHKALRLFMFDTVIAIQQTDMTDEKAASAIIEQTLLLLDIFDAHAHHEDTFILTLAEKHDPDLIKAFESEHVIDMQLTEDLRSSVEGYQQAKDTLQKLQTATALYYALNEFIAFNLSHMNKEERELNQLLWTHFTDDEIMAMEHRITQNIPHEKMAIYSQWMIKGINNRELNTWLDAVKNTAPHFVYEGLLHDCRNHLPAEKYALVVNHQTAECLIA